MHSVMFLSCCCTYYYYLLAIPLVDGCCILFSGYLLEHRQENVVIESKSISNHNCERKFVDVSVYSNRRFTNNMLKTTERVFKETRSPFY